MKLPNTVRPDLVSGLLSTTSTPAPIGSRWVARKYCPSCAYSLTSKGRLFMGADSVKHEITITGHGATDGALPCPYLVVQMVCMRCKREESGATIHQSSLADWGAKEPKA